MNFVKKFLPLLIIAVVFAAGGYFIGHGSVENQGAALYKGTKTLNPCDNSPVNPCPETKVNSTCPEGFSFVNGRCVIIEAYTKSSVEISVGTRMDASQWAEWCKTHVPNGYIGSDGRCYKGAVIAPGATGASNTAR